MGTYQLNPNGDWDNDGWSLFGSGVTHLFQAWGAVGDDTKYASSPASKAVSIVEYPEDITAIPAGAKIVSVTVTARVAQGAASPPAEQSAAVTIGLSSSDDTDRSLVRTIYPTSTTPTTTTVGTYKLDPTGHAWDVERLNHVLAKVYTPNAVADAVRVYELTITANYRVVPVITVTAPSGVQGTASPVVSFVYRQSDGDTQSGVDWRLFTSAQQALTAFDPNATTPLDTDRVEGDIRSFTLPTSLTPGSYWIYLRVHSVFDALSAWTGKQFTVAGPLPGVPGVPDPTGGHPGVGIVQTIADSAGSSATLTVCDTSNMMSVQDADASTVTDGTTWDSVNCTDGVRDTTVSYPGGTASWQLKSAAGGDMSLVGDWIEATANTQITGRAQFIAASVPRNCSIRLSFYDDNFVSTGADLVSAPIIDSTTTWTEAIVTGITPTGTQLVVPTVTVSATGAANEVHNVTRIGVMYGTNTAYSDGGHLSRNLLSAWYSNAEGSPGAGEAWTGGASTAVSVVDPTGTGASGNACQALTYSIPTPTVAFRAAGTVFTSPTLGAGFTLTAPVGIMPSDLMLAYVWTSGEDLGVISAPAGWSVVDFSTVQTAGTDLSQFVLKRTAGASEPPSWTDGTLGANTQQRSAVVVAYSGAADASLQFIAEGISGSSNTSPTQITSPTVTNTDSGAWRVSAFGFVDDHTGGSVTANQLAPGAIPAIAFVGRATAWKATGGTALTFTVNRPSGVASGDLMVATVEVAGTMTFTAPTGWTIAYQGNANKASMAVMYRYAGASEPASWGGSYAGTYTNNNSRARISECAAYRNVNASTPFIAQAGTSSSGGSNIITPALTNTDARAWRVTAFGMRSPSPGTTGNWSSTDVAERSDDGVTTSTEGVATAMFDSSGAVGTGSITVTGTPSQSYYGASAWMGFLNPLATAPGSPGNESSRASGAVGANPVLYGAAFDSNGTVPLGATSVTGIFAPGSGAGIQDATGWVGLISPNTQTHAGYSSATMATTVDISKVDARVAAVAGNQMSATVAFNGSSAGTPYLTMNFYRANQLLESVTQQGESFDGVTWEKSTCVFPIPDGTTRVALGVGVADRLSGDVSYFDRVSVAYGNETVYRAGTSRAAHTVWALPQLECADDSGEGYGAFRVISGTQKANPPSYDAFTGISQYVDHTVIPLTNRRYRAKTVCLGLQGDQFVSAYGPSSAEFFLTAESWWIKDVANPANNVAVRVRFETVTVNTTNTAVPYQGLGASLPTVLTEGFKGDTFTITAAPLVREEWVQLSAMLKSGNKMFLQSDIDQSWWVQCVGDISVDWLPTDGRKSLPLRALKVMFMEVSAPL